MLTTDFTPALLHLSKDPVLAQIIVDTPGVDSPVPKPAYDWADNVYLALLESIVSQQISVKAADAIFTRFRALFVDNYPHADALLLKTPDELRSAGLSFQKIKYLQSVAEFTQHHPLDRAHLDPMSDEEIVQYLLPIKGVGRWTVEMLLMFVLDRPDVFPIDDLVIRQKMIRAYPDRVNGLTGKALYKALHDIAAAWQPYRTTACRYLWRWKPTAVLPAPEPLIER
ncbi:DNA-3-methyladenine glycosylase family protein [Spirosoma montaniterrae]|uniref:DNA-3-methyladenine glycosylase II n=1 Tax=Spirosoma montaniterrae TaxID=1178516 RepID=A0A1P9WUK5_9BACT|nr:DNA-3-methyladenine glycosylase [Spirosoma montaniterrae]AQG79061.1 Fe-S cluster assembly protein HesB [Spirosoma montaniterrae]